MPTVSGNHETLVTELVTNNYLIKKVYIDAGSSIDIMCYRIFQQVTYARPNPVGRIWGACGMSQGYDYFNHNSRQASQIQTIQVNYTI